MAEIFGAVTAAAGILDQAIQLFDRVRTAVQRQKDLPELVKKYSAEVTETRSIVELVKNEDSLRTPNVGTSITKLGAVGKTLRDHLDKMAVTKGPVRDFFHQLVSGKGVEDKLDSIMKDMGNAKTDLSICIQLSNVGLIRGVGDAVQVNTANVAAMNKQLVEKLGSGHELRISKLLEGKPRNADGTVTLTKDDIALLAEPIAPNASIESSIAPGTKSRLVVMNNEAYRHALQLNSPIGVDVWKDIDIIVEKNKSADHAIQINAPVSAESFLATLSAMKGASSTE